jgi:hypothetical protein
MKDDFELESRLKSIRVPERTPEYWENFPSQVRANLRPARATVSFRKTLLPQLAWSGGFALACLLFGAALGPVFQGVLQHEKPFRRELAQLPNHLRVFMADEHGMHYLVADQK